MPAPKRSRDRPITEVTTVPASIDAYAARFVHEVAPEDAAAAAAAHAATLRYELVPGFALPARAAGAGWGGDAVDGTLSASASASVGAGCDCAPAVTEAAAHMSRLGDASGGGAPPLPPAADLHGDFSVAPQLALAWESTYGAESRAAAIERLNSSGGADTALLTLQRPFTPLQWALWGAVNNYRDVYFAARTHANARELRSMAALHVANHVFKARERVNEHDALLRAAAGVRRAAHLEAVAAAAAAAADVESTALGGSDTASAAISKGKARRKRLRHGKPVVEEGAAAVAARGGGGGGAGVGGTPAEAGEVQGMRDQGFTRPTVLVLLPTRHAALLWVRSLLRLFAHVPTGRAARKAKRVAIETGGVVSSALGFGEDDRALAVEATMADAASIAPVPVAPFTKRPILNRSRFFREFSEEGSGLGGDFEEDEDEVAAGATPSALAAIARRSREMMSEDEGTSTEEEAREEDARGGEGAYTFARNRQGWQKGLREKVRREARAASAAAAAEEAAAKAAGAGAVSAKAPSSQPAHVRKRQRAAAVAAETSILGGFLKNEADREKARVRAVKAERQAARLAARLREEEGRASHDADGEGVDDAPNALRRRSAFFPPDHRAAFAGNIDDDFRVGIALGKKGVTLYSEFYDSDIIVASPLGLRRIIGGSGDRAKERDYDFLSSIEVCLLDGTDAMAAQNWAHVSDVFDVLNVTPTAPRDTDFRRVREWALAGLSRAFRQTIAFAGGLSPDVARLLRKQCANTRGGMLLRASYAGAVSSIAIPVRQTFMQVLPPPPIATADDARFACFMKRVLPDLLASLESGGASARVLIYVPSYFDYVRIRNALDARDVEFVTCSEYSEDKDISRARSRFSSGASPLMLLSERFHYFRRLRLTRGVTRLLFYAPPTSPAFYGEFINLLEDRHRGGGVAGGDEGGDAGGGGGGGGLPTATVLYTRHDAAPLERIVGSARLPAILSADKRVILTTE